MDRGEAGPGQRGARDRSPPPDHGLGPRQLPPGDRPRLQLRRRLRHGPARHGHEERPVRAGLLRGYGFLFTETHALKDEAARRYGFLPLAFRPDLSAGQQAVLHGPELWKDDPDLCCEIRKVAPNERALEGRRAWITGLRRDQGETRRDVAIAAWDTRFDLVKINPLAAWTEDDVWNYVRENDVPYNDLHDRGYPSIGCTHCTRAVRPGEDPRAGRWSGGDKVECGIHIDPVTAEVVSTTGNRGEADAAPSRHTTLGRR
jgi:phosphoadenosine phosphosulfate reductase